MNMLGDGIGYRWFSPTDEEEALLRTYQEEQKTILCGVSNCLANQPTKEEQLRNLRQQVLQRLREVN